MQKGGTTEYWINTMEMKIWMWKQSQNLKIISSL